MSHQPQNEVLTKPASPKLVAIHTQSTPLVNSGQVVKSQLSAGEVALVGAGPGDPELLTLKAFHYLQQADVVLYDYLVSDAIMALIPAQTQTLCVGKRAGQHSMPQEAINQHLVDFALQGLRVVRIKGGDPFMFGRGGEELEALFDAGIRFQVVPGITAAAGATAYAGIPLTHRDYAQSALFITGHLKAGEQDSTNWATLAISNQTLVIYMGLMKADYIRQQLMAHGRAAHTPIAIIERGTDSAQKVYQGELSDLAVLAQEAGSPALIVIGDVVKLATKLAWFNQEPTLNSQYQYA